MDTHLRFLHELFTVKVHNPPTPHLASDIIHPTQMRLLNFISYGPRLYSTSSTSSLCSGFTTTFSINCNVALSGSPTTLSNVPSILSTKIVPKP